jgi:hypothetical protein
VKPIHGVALFVAGWTLGIAFMGLIVLLSERMA